MGSQDSTGLAEVPAGPWLAPNTSPAYSRREANQAAAQPSAAPGRPDTTVIFIGGGSTGSGEVPEEDWVFFRTQAKDIRQAAAAAGQTVDIAVFYASAHGGETEAAVVERVENNASGRLILVGYSRGGDLVVDVAEALNPAGIEVDLLVAMDPTPGTPQPWAADTVVPGNVALAVNYFQVDSREEYLAVVADQWLDNPMGSSGSAFTGGGYRLEVAGDGDTWLLNVLVPDTTHIDIFADLMQPVTDLVTSSMASEVPEIAMTNRSGTKTFTVYSTWFSATSPESSTVFRLPDGHRPAHQRTRGEFYLDAGR